MAKNCLVTKLKASVNNNSLDKLGMFSVFFKQEASPTQDSRFLMVVSTEKNTIKCTEGLFYKVYGGTSIGDSYTLVDSDWSEQYGGYVFSGFVSNTACRVDIPKYTLKRVQVVTNGASVYDIDLSKFKYTQVQLFSGRYLSGSVADLPDNTTSVNFNGNLKIKGTLADFSRLTSITYLNTGNSSIESSLLSSLGTITALTTMQVAASGSIEGFVGVQRANGRTTCDGIDCVYLGAGNITFNGEQIVNKASATLTWTASTITYDGVTITA